MRGGGEYFLEPAEAVQRRYEALRCSFMGDASAKKVGARFGYSPATVHQLRTYTPVLIHAGFPELDIPIPWWNGRSLRFGLPPR